MFILWVLAGALQVDPCSYGLNLRAQELLQSGNYQEAANLSREIVKELETGAGGCRLAAALINLAAAHQGLGNVTEAERRLGSALRVWEKVGPEGQSGILLVRNNLLSLYIEGGQYDKADLVMRQIRAMPFEALSRTPLDHAQLLNNLASVAMVKRKYKEASSHYREAIRTLQQAGSNTETEMAAILNNLAVLLIQLREYEEAKQYLTQAISALENRFGPAHPSLVMLLRTLSEVEMRQRRVHEAEILLARAIHISETALGSDHPATAAALEAYTAVLRQLGRKREAEIVDRKASEILDPYHASIRALSHTVDVRAFTK